ncbi:MAG TPA: hypothetical protein VIM86_10125 [Thermodesulfobacteriota bacterium]
MTEIRVRRRRRPGAWIWVLAALVALIVVFLFAFPGEEDRTADEPGGAPARSGAAPAPGDPAAPPAR